MFEPQPSKTPDPTSRRAVLRECADRVEAETIRIRLSVEGIDAFISGTDSAHALSMGGAGTDRLVRVEVLEDDFPFAHQLLLEDEQRVVSAGPWICGRCHEQNEAPFELCWNCKKQRDDTDERGRRDEVAEEPLTKLDTPTQVSETLPKLPKEDGNPYRPVLLPRVTEVNAESKTIPFRATDKIHDDVKRAFRASVAGVFVLPPLVTFYSVYLILNTNLTEAYRDRQLRGWLIAAVCIDLLVLVAVYGFLQEIFK